MENEKEQKERVALQEKLFFAQEHIKTLESVQSLKQAELNAANRKAEKAQHQLELLREMYNELLDRMKLEE